MDGACGLIPRYRDIRCSMAGGHNGAAFEAKRAIETAASAFNITFQQI